MESAVWSAYAMSLADEALAEYDKGPEVNVNERIARALGWRPWREANPQIDWASMDDYYAGWGWKSPAGKREPSLPDYEHSLDALLEPLAVLEGYSWGVGKYRDDSMFVATLTQAKFGAVVALHSHTATTPAEALALVVAEALEGQR